MASPNFGSSWPSAMLVCGRGAFDDAQRADDGQRLLLPADLEIAQRALRLRAPIAVGVHFDGAEGVGLGPGGVLLLMAPFE